MSQTKTCPGLSAAARQLVRALTADQRQTLQAALVGGDEALGQVDPALFNAARHLVDNATVDQRQALRQALQEVEP